MEVHQVLHFVILLFKPLALWTIKTITKNVYVRSVSERVLLNPGHSNNFTYDLHKEWSEKLSAKTKVNIFFNKEQKYTNDSVKKKGWFQKVDFKVTFGFLMFSEIIKREHWGETGQAF